MDVTISPSDTTAFTMEIFMAGVLCFSVQGKHSPGQTDPFEDTSSPRLTLRPLKDQPPHKILGYLQWKRAIIFIIPIRSPCEVQLEESSRCFPEI